MIRVPGRSNVGSALENMMGQEVSYLDYPLVI